MKKKHCIMLNVPRHRQRQMPVRHITVGVKKKKKMNTKEEGDVRLKLK